MPRHSLQAKAGSVCFPERSYVSAGQFASKSCAKACNSFRNFEATSLNRVRSILFQMNTPSCQENRPDPDALVGITKRESQIGDRGRSLNRR